MQSLTQQFMSEEEIAVRAQFAADSFANKALVRVYRAGAESALRDLSKPLSEIQPVGLDLIEARKLVAARYAPGTCEVTMVDAILRGDEDRSPAVLNALTAIKHGRELERQS